MQCCILLTLNTSRPCCEQWLWKGVGSPASQSTQWEPSTCTVPSSCCSSLQQGQTLHPACGGCSSSARTQDPEISHEHTAWCFLMCLRKGLGAFICFHKETVLGEKRNTFNTIAWFQPCLTRGLLSQRDQAFLNFIKIRSEEGLKMDPWWRRL